MSPTMDYIDRVISHLSDANVAIIYGNKSLKIKIAEEIVIAMNRNIAEQEVAAWIVLLLQKEKQ